MTQPNESALVTAILDLCRLHRHLIRLQRTPAGDHPVGRWKGEPGQKVLTPAGLVRAAEEGWPDLTGFVPAGLPKRSGKAVLVECKRATSQDEAFGLLTPLQQENLEDVVAAGGVGILAWDAAQFWAEYLEAVGMTEREGLVVPIRKPKGIWKPCECARTYAA